MNFTASESAAHVAKRLGEMSKLEKGWMYGEGEVITSKAMEIAIFLFSSYEGPRFTMFPALDGGITVEFPGTDKEDSWIMANGIVILI